MNAVGFRGLVKRLADATVQVHIPRRLFEGAPGEELRTEVLRKLEVTLFRAGAASMGFQPDVLPTSLAPLPNAPRGPLPRSAHEAFDALLANLESLRESVAACLTEEANTAENDSPEESLTRAALHELVKGLEEIFGETKGQN